MKLFPLIFLCFMGIEGCSAQTLEIPYFTRPGLLQDHLKSLESSSTANTYNQQMANGNSKIFGCSGNEVDLTSLTCQLRTVENLISRKKQTVIAEGWRLETSGYPIR